jgi:hypothetical protein
MKMEVDTLWYAPGFETRKESSMSDNLRRYRAIREALRQWYPSSLNGHSKFAKLMNGQSETQLAWRSKMLLSPMVLSEFAAIVVTFLRRNLDAVFGSDVNANGVMKEFYEWTRGNWWYIHELIKALDSALGSTRKSGEPRVITEAVMKRLRDTWVKRIGSIQTPEDSGEGSKDGG